MSSPPAVAEEVPAPTDGYVQPRVWSRRRFFVALGAVTSGALVLRVLYVLLVTRHAPTKLYDAGYYELQGLTLSQGHFFPVLFGRAPDAAHPPLTALTLVPVSYVFGLHPGATPQSLTMAVFGALVVFFVGMLGRRVAGPRVGIVAAVLAAVYPNMWMPSGIVMSETLTMLATVLTLLAVYRLLRTPSWTNAALVGAGCGAGMLARAELVAFLPLLVAPAALACTRASWGRRLAFLAISVLTALLVVGPWVGRNLAAFRDPTYLSTGDGPVVLGANCPQTYAGHSLGSWNLECSLQVPPAKDQSVESARQFDAGRRYLERHLSRLPVVALARAGRVWDLYRPLQMARVDVNEGRPVPASLAGLAVYYLLLPVAAVGALWLRRHRITLWPLLVPALTVTIVAVAGYGLVRFRAEFEVCLVVLAAVGATAAWQRLVQRGEQLRQADASPGPHLGPQHESIVPR